MRNFNQPSRCSSHEACAFRWFGYPAANLKADVQVALERFISIVQGDSEKLNPYILADAKAQFLTRMDLASTGELKPVSMIKPVDTRNPPPLFEIRWQGIQAGRPPENGNAKHAEIPIRMYHSEPESQPGYFIGHHIHEKIVSGLRSPNELQNEEIETAKGHYRRGLNTNWGIRSQDPSQ